LLNKYFSSVSTKEKTALMPEVKNRDDSKSEDEDLRVKNRQFHGVQ